MLHTPENKQSVDIQLNIHSSSVLEMCHAWSIFIKETFLWMHLSDRFLLNITLNSHLLILALYINNHIPGETACGVQSCD